MKRNKIILGFIFLGLACGCRMGSSSNVETTNENRDVSITKESVPQKHSSTDLAGKVVHISDGDTFIVEAANGERTTVRIHAIDAPELAQTFGKESRENLRALIANQQVEIHEYDRDQYHRVVGSVFLNGKDIGLEQVKGGYAWHFKQYQKEQPQDERAAYAAAEDTARNARAGLWRDGDAANPQDYRRSHPRR